MLINIFVNLNFALWRHAFASSDLLFRHLGLDVCLPMAAFSSRQRGQLSFPGVYGCTIFNISHVIGGFGLRSFFHIYADSVVEFWFVIDLKLFI